MRVVKIARGYYCLAKSSRVSKSGEPRISDLTFRPMWMSNRGYISLRVVVGRSSVVVPDEFEGRKFRIVFEEIR